MTTPFPNLYTHRKVADTAAKACDICYKSSTSVLITPDKKDFFFVCPVHLKDRYFCTPKVDEDAEKAKREKELEEEKERVKKEYEERQRKKKDKEKEKEDKDKKKGKDEDKDKDKDKDEKEKGKDDETKVGFPWTLARYLHQTDHVQDKEENNPTPEPEEPRVFELKSSFYQQRLMKKRQAEAARIQRERVSKPGYFPSVPSDAPSR
ncbi:hypothetical protein ACHAPT_009132 [Fusarium lateritium]